MSKITNDGVKGLKMPLNPNEPTSFSAYVNASPLRSLFPRYKTAAAALRPFRPGNPALCGSRPVP